MLTKFETKSNRVKGLSFHPKRYAVSISSKCKCIRQVLTDVPGAKAMLRSCTQMHAMIELASGLPGDIFSL